MIFWLLLSTFRFSQYLTVIANNQTTIKAIGCIFFSDSSPGVKTLFYPSVFHIHFLHFSCYLDQDNNHAAEEDLAKVCVWGVNEKAAELLVMSHSSYSDTSTACETLLVLLIIAAAVMMSAGVERDEWEGVVVVMTGDEVRAAADVDVAPLWPTQEPSR